MSEADGLEGPFGVPVTPPTSDNDESVGDDADFDGDAGRHQVADECLEPWRYICKTPGKNVRSMMIECFNIWLNIPEAKVRVIKQIVGFLHNASLLIDDIEDDSKLRRGKPVAHMVYGVPQTLNCANYVYFLAMEKCMSLESTEVLRIFTQELLNLHRGQGRELYWRENSLCPTEDEYVDMVVDKTGGLFRIAVGLMTCFSTTEDDFTRLVNLLAVYFQVRDDLINLASKNYQRNKSYCEDLTEGKYSFPIIHAVSNAPKGDTQVASILKQRTENFELKASVVAVLRHETKSFEYTNTYLENVYEQIMKEIELLGGSPKLVALLDKLKEEVNECEL